MRKFWPEHGLRTTVLGSHLTPTSLCSGGYGWKDQRKRGEKTVRNDCDGPNERRELKLGSGWRNGERKEKVSIY